MKASKIGDNRICFFDKSLVDFDKTTASLIWHKPNAKDYIFIFDKKWEEKVSYPHIFKDGDIYKMYYMATCRHGIEVDLDKWMFTCMLTSKDGITWERPIIGLHEFEGSKENNIVYPYPMEFSVFKDTNPNAKPTERYKALNHLPGIRELYYLYSEDGINFSERIKISDKENFDTLSTAFYDEEKGKYVAYVRGLHYTDYIVDGEKKTRRFRDVKYMTSDDFINWSDPVPLNFLDDYEEYEIYTNCIFTYFNAPQYKIAFPTRYYDNREWSPTFENLTGKADRLGRAITLPRAAIALTDTIFMCSTDDINWQRSPSAFLTPGIEQDKNWVYGDCFPARGSLMETTNELFGTKEMSFFDVSKLKNALIRYTMRVDGFASYSSQESKKVLTTKPFIFKGENLRLNVATSARGGVYVFLKTEEKTLESYEVLGDSIDKLVSFKNGKVKELEGKEVVMSIEFVDADVYSFKFGE